MVAVSTTLDFRAHVYVVALYRNDTHVYTVALYRNGYQNTCVYAVALGRNDLFRNINKNNISLRSTDTVSWS